MKETLILSINPGSTSTKFALFNNTTCILEKTIRHSIDEISVYPTIIDQFDFRKTLIIEELKNENVKFESIKYVIGRGGITHPLESGIYEVNEAMLAHLRSGEYGQHASNLGGVIANDIAKWLGDAKAYIADPVVTDELDDIARISGHPAFVRKTIFHALNQKAIAREHAKAVNRPYEELRLIVAHLGGGISVGAHKNGRIVDVNNALDGEGPFSPERSGTLPAGQLIDICFSGKYTKEKIKKMVNGEGGFVAYLGTNDGKSVKERAAAGDQECQFYQNAMGYQIAKIIGEMATVLDGRVDGVLFTGGVAYNAALLEYIRPKVDFIAPVYIYAGEDELKALAMNVSLMIQGKLTPKIYK
ncbi:MAG: butyrate kinase [Bacteroidota bacterium]|nr:butyrate kinase [Bacteroidota bacterium]MDP4206229.1 butyrate kinase [Bacteroidota bacterium]